MDLIKQIRLILESEKSAYSQNGRIRGGLGSFNVTLQSVPNGGWANEGSITKYLYDEVGRDFIKSENAELLLRIYSSLDNTRRGVMEGFLLSYLDKSNELKDVAYLIAFVFIRIGKLELALLRSFTALKGDANNAYSNVLHMYKLVVSREYTYLTLHELSSIRSLLQDDPEAKHALLPTLTEACKKLIQQGLDNTENSEIVEDMQNLVTFFHVNVPGGDISNQIKHIEDLFKKGEFDEQSYATCVDRMRVLMVSVVKYLATRKGIKNPNIKDDKSLGKFLYDNKHITESEHDLLTAFYSLCSNNGSHISKTDKNTARLVKNMGYEIVALLASYSE